MCYPSPWKLRKGKHGQSSPSCPWYGINSMPAWNQKRSSCSQNQRSQLPPFEAAVSPNSAHGTRKKQFLWAAAIPMPGPGSPQRRKGQTQSKRPRAAVLSFHSWHRQFPRAQHSPWGNWLSPSLHPAQDPSCLVKELFNSKCSNISKLNGYGNKDTATRLLPSMRHWSTKSRSFSIKNKAENLPNKVGALKDFPLWLTLNLN